MRAPVKEAARVRFPLVATLVVLVAVAIMLRLGFWQLDRLHEKETLLARYAAHSSNPLSAAYPTSVAAIRDALYRRSQLDCSRVSGWQAIAGRNAKGEPGFAHETLCAIEPGKTAYVVVGWSRDPQSPKWQGGVVNGRIAPRGKAGSRLIADPPIAGLQASARPDPGDVPNNHFSYAVQWFLFAATALVIYGIALAKRLAAPGA